MANEEQKIAALTRIFAAGGERLLRGIGDDAAVVRPDGAVIVTSVDAVAEGFAFTREHFPPRAIGHKAAAAALSDLAAMGASAGEVYVAAGLPEDFTDDEFEQLAHGLLEAVQGAGAVMAGGDLTAAAQLWVSATVVGYAESEQHVVARAGARAGDVIAVTGTLGGAAAGLLLLTGDADAAVLSEDVATALRDKQLAPRPLIGVGQALAEHGANAMIDVSDGIARDAGQLAAASGVAIEIDLTKLPIAAGVAELTADPQKFAAESGEEYQLLCAIDPARFEAAREAVVAAGSTLSEIGRARDGAGASFLGGDGRPVAVAGYQHFD